MTESSSYTYADAGVSIAAGNALVKAIGPLAKATRRTGADADLGGFGGLLGVTIGVALAAMISSIGIPMPPPPGTTRGYTGEILVTWNIAFESLLLAIGATLIASIYPAWKASRMQIVDALRHNR